MIHFAIPEYQGMPDEYQSLKCKRCGYRIMPTRNKKRWKHILNWWERTGWGV